ncbi:MAG: PEGA domain-containing protein [Actinomycetota bacterium]
MRRSLIISFCLFGFGIIAQAQSSTPDTSSAEKPRVFITDSRSWEIESAAAGSGGVFAAASRGGARPQTAEIIKTFGEKCPGVMVNNIREKAAYIVVLDHEGGKGLLRHKNKVAVFDAQSGDSIVSKSTLSLGGSVEEACRAIEKHWADRKPAAPAASQSAAEPESGARLEPAVARAPAANSQNADTAGASLSITSVPEGADIEIDGAFMGNAPSSLQLRPGDHKVVVSKKGYKPWERTLKVTGGNVSIRAELEKD